MNNMASRRPSFASEHTVEYYLVPYFRKLLESHFDKVVPFFYWSSREGNSRSRNSDFGKSIRLCAMFPRRPKLNNSSNVVMKVNEEVFSMAFDLQEVGIPVFLGIPIVHSIFEFSDDFEFRWYSINRASPSQSDYEIECEEPNTSTNHESILTLCTEMDICKSIENKSHLVNWKEALEKLRQVQFGGINGRGHRSRFGSVYKPSYFMVW